MSRMRSRAWQFVKRRSCQNGENRKHCEKSSCCPAEQFAAGEISFFTLSACADRSKSQAQLKIAARFVNC